MRPTLILTLLSLTVALPAQWNQTNPATPPSPRRAGAMAFDPTGNRLILQGGITATPSQILSQTWAFNGQWSLLAATSPARWGHRMVTNTQTNRIVTFGGRSPTISALANDTWEFDGTNWTQVATTGAPSRRFHYGMAYDAARDRIVLFGGRTSTGASNQTWEFDGTTWTQATPPNAPAAREEMGMVYDASLGRVVLFGGCNETLNAVYGDTWVYDGVDWQEVTPANSPSPRFRGAMVFDNDRNRTVYFGGYDNVATFDDTYEYAGGEWVLVPPGTSAPPNTTETYHAYDSQRDRFVIFGGFSTVFTNETWEFTGNDQGVFLLYGDACDTAVGTPSLSGSTPTIGQTLTLTCDNLGSFLGTVFVLGLSNQSYLGTPLPLDLGFIGLAGCGLLASPDLINLGVNSGGTATFAFPIPLQTNLVSQSLYAQAIVIDVTPGLTFLGASRGGRALIGN